MLEVEKPLAETSMDVDGAGQEAKGLESKLEWRGGETKYANDVSGTPPVRSICQTASICGARDLTNHEPPLLTSIA